MLDCLLDLEEPMPYERQTLLFTMLNGNRDWDNLARMCLLPNLAPELDTKLSKVGSAKVKASWMSRPGRSSEEIAKAVRGERRISVLESLAASTDVETILTTMLYAASGLRIAIAVLNNEQAPDNVKRDAGRVLGERLDNTTTRSLRSEALKAAVSHPDAIAAFAACSTDPEVLGLACELEKPSLALRNHIVTAGVVQPLKRLQDKIDTGKIDMGHYNAVYRIRECISSAATVAVHVTGSVWAGDAEVTAMKAAFESLRPASKHAEVTRIISESITRMEAARGDGGLLLTAQTAPAKKVPAILTRMQSLPWRSDLKTLTAQTLVNRTDLPLSLRLQAAENLVAWEVQQYPQRYSMHAVLLSSLGGRYSGVTGETLVATMKQSGHTGWEQELRVLHAAARAEKLDVYSDRIAAALISTELVDEELVSTMPLSFVVAHRGQAANRILGKLLSEQLPDNLRVWEEAQKLAPKFPGTVKDLVIVAKAACGVQ